MINWKRAWWLYFQSKQKGHHNNVNTNWSAVNTLSKNFPTMPHPGFDYLFAALSWKFILSQTHVGLTKMKTCSTTIFPSPQDNIFLSYWKEIYCLKLEFICSNSAIITVEWSSKWTTEAPDALLVSLLLTLNIFDTLFLCFVLFFADFEYVNAGWNTLLLNLNLYRRFRVGSWSHVTFKTKLCVTTISSHYLFYITKSSILDVA